MTFETGVEADECLKYNGHAYDNKQITVKVSAKNDLDVVNLFA